jgi:hypothetical protein
MDIHLFLRTIISRPSLGSYTRYLSVDFGYSDDYAVSEDSEAFVGEGSMEELTAKEGPAPVHTHPDDLHSFAACRRRFNLGWLY